MTLFSLTPFDPTKSASPVQYRPGRTSDNRALRDHSSGNSRRRNRGRRMTSTAPPTTLMTHRQTFRACAGPANKSAGEHRLQDVIILESCHSTWVFDSDRMQFCRILKGIKIASRSVSTEWRPYWRLELDPKTEAFSVYFNASRTRLIRSWRHLQNCAQCGGNGTTELTLDDIQHALLVEDAAGVSAHASTGKPAIKSTRQRSVRTQPPETSLLVESQDWPSRHL